MSKENVKHVATAAEEKFQKDGGDKKAESETLIADAMPDEWESRKAIVRSACQFATQLVERLTTDALAEITSRKLNLPADWSVHLEKERNPFSSSAEWFVQNVRLKKKRREHSANMSKLDDALFYMSGLRMIQAATENGEFWMTTRMQQLEKKVEEAGMTLVKAMSYKILCATFYHCAVVKANNQNDTEFQRTCSMREFKKMIPDVLGELRKAKLDTQLDTELLEAKFKVWQEEGCPPLPNVES